MCRHNLSFFTLAVVLVMTVGIGYNPNAGAKPPKETKLKPLGFTGTGTVGGRDGGIDFVMGMGGSSTKSKKQTAKKVVKQKPRAPKASAATPGCSCPPPVYEEPAMTPLE